LVIVVVEAEVVLLFHQVLAEVNVGASFVDVRGDSHLQSLIEKKIRRDQWLLMVGLLRSNI